MSKLEILKKELIAYAEAPRKAVLRSMKDTGKEAVGCFPIYTPEEIVYAAGYLPVGMWGGKAVGNKADKYLQSFCCSVMKANMEQALDGQYDFLKAVLITAYCDTLKCIIENWKIALPQLKVIPVIYAQNRKTNAGRVYMAEEFERIKKEMEKLSGKEITEKDLQDALKVYEDYRIAARRFAEAAGKHPQQISAYERHMILKAGWFMDKQVYTQKLEAVTAELEAAPETDRGYRKVILTGLMSEPVELLQFLDENKLCVVADDLAQESRQFRDAEGTGETAVEKMVSRYAKQDGCAFLYDAAKSRIELIQKLADDHNADAVVFCQMKFCDPEEFDFPLIKKNCERNDIPLLYLETELTMDGMEQIRTRIQSFAEMLIR